MAAYGADKLSPGTQGAMDSYRKGYVHAVQMCLEHSPGCEKKRVEATVNPSKSQSLGVPPAKKKSTC